jgi:deoxyhypusine monooxygenase
VAFVPLSISTTNPEKGISIPMSQEAAIDAFAAAAKECLDRALPLDQRIRALYVLKEHRQQRREELSNLLLKAVDTTDSVLLQHEFLYNVGQLGCLSAIPSLQAIAPNVDQYDIVSRHEAIEALGAIGDKSTVEFLKKLMNDFKAEAPIAESALLAITRIEKRQEEGFTERKHPEFASVDPSPASALWQNWQKQGGQEGSKKDVIAALGDILNDESRSLWDRYEAMFALRNFGSEDAVAQLSRALRQDRSSCLFRHEIAFVLGQLEDPRSSHALVDALKDTAEHPMVRHEAAEALGAVAAKADWDILQTYASDPQPLVRDSCVVALDMHRYWSKFKPTE